MGNFKSYRDGSRGNYGANQDEGLNKEQITLGAILRIADATEAMAKNHTDLLGENLRLKNSIRWLQEDAKAMKNKITAYKGVITKLKKQISNNK